MRKKRKFNKTEGYKYDSKWEEGLVKGVLKNFEYHPDIIEYTKPSTTHKYYPDWKLDSGMRHPKDINRTCVFIEAKGRFRDRAEYVKYKYIRDALLDDEELVFLFMKPYCPMPHAKKRKDGTILTHAEWATKNKFRWFTEETINDLIVENSNEK